MRFTYFRDPPEYLPCQPRPDSASGDRPNDLYANWTWNAEYISPATIFKHVLRELDEPQNKENSFEPTGHISQKHVRLKYWWVGSGGLWIEYSLVRWRAIVREGLDIIVSACIYWVDNKDSNNGAANNAADNRAAAAINGQNNRTTLRSAQRNRLLNLPH